MAGSVLCRLKVCGPDADWEGTGKPRGPLGEDMAADTIRVLIIDDDPDLAFTVCEVLRAHGYEAESAENGEKGLERAFTGHPHLILLDVMMPGMDGYQVCRELQFGYTKDIPVVFLTAKTELANMVEANRAGASAYITKPFHPERLLQTVKEVLRDASVYHDDITGLPTLARAQVEIQRHAQDHAQLGLLYVTIDGIHSLERLHGFEAVDEVYRSVSRRLSETPRRLMREDDYLAVASLGDAFLVVLAPPRESGHLSDEDLIVVKDRLQGELTRHLGGDLESRLAAPIDLYVGCARLVQSPKVRFRRALLEAIEQATLSIDHERSQTRHRLGTELDRVLTSLQISCVYQPIVTLGDFAVLGYELLARGPVRSELHFADALFETARAEHRLHELDRVCRIVAARGSATLPSGCLRFINAEPSALFSQMVGDLWMEEFVEATPPELRTLTVMEITEKSVIEDFVLMRDVVRRLRERGFRIAVDDAGAGYSGLQTMVEIEPDFIKLDMSLTRGIESSHVKQKLVGTLRDFCAQAGIGLIAEGIETHAQLDALAGLGIAHGQGFLFAHPGSPYPLRDIIAPGRDDVRPPAPALS
jgi:EAL domain-containing protein (putative c-di-GMP-specific phosphodiesterase class I)/CheY-like chemotaxis protein